VNEAYFAVKPLDSNLNRQGAKDAKFYKQHSAWLCIFDLLGALRVLCGNEVFMLCCFALSAFSAFTPLVVIISNGVNLRPMIISLLSPVF
jgi:hypothetical protein